MEFKRITRSQTYSDENAKVSTVTNEVSRLAVDGKQFLGGESGKNVMLPAKVTSRAAFDDVNRRNTNIDRNKLEQTKKSHNEETIKRIAQHTTERVDRPEKKQYESDSECDMSIQTEECKDIIDIDLLDHDDPLQYSEYVLDVYEYLRNLEIQHKIADNFMLSQKDVNEKMRLILVDWLVQVHNRFRLLTETLLLSIQIIDRFLEKQFVARNEFQLLGVTATLVAAKYEEMVLPEIKDFVFITDSAYTESQIRAMEVKILRVLDFDLSCPVSLHFLRRFSKAVCAPSIAHRMAKYFIEMTMMDVGFSTLLPSYIAAVSLALAMELIGEGNWTRQLEYYCKYSYQSLVPGMRKIASHILNSETSAYRAIYKKYSDKKNDSISEHEALKSMVFRQLAEASQKTTLSCERSSQLGRFSPRRNRIAH